MDVNKLEKNLRFLLKGTPDLLISFVLTTTALSVFNLKTLFKKILEWAEKSFQIMFKKNLIYLQSNEAIQSMKEYQGKGVAY